MRLPSLRAIVASARGPATGSRPARWWTALLALLVAGILLVLAFRGANWNEMWATAQRGNTAYLAIGCALLSSSGLLRGLRWRVLLSSERGLSAAAVFWATMVGYLGNALLPARAGEVIRSVLIGRHATISKSYVLATVLTERILDGLALLAIGSLGIAALPSVPAALLAASRTFLVVVVAGGLALLVLPSFRHVLPAWLARLPLKAQWRDRLGGMALEFLLGMRAFQHPRRALSFAALTASIWIEDSMLALVVARAFGLTLTVPQAVVFLASLGLSSAAPSTPGYLGIYQFVAVAVLVPFGFSQNEALVYILAFQMVSYVVVLTWGSLGLWRLSRISPVPSAGDTGGRPSLSELTDSRSGR
jgi:uncharacterized protein (TIRG00374 family)